MRMEDNFLFNEFTKKAKTGLQSYNNNLQKFKDLLNESNITDLSD